MPPCPNCSAELRHGDIFCRSCGIKAVDDEQETRIRRADRAFAIRNIEQQLKVDQEEIATITRSMHRSEIECAVLCAVFTGLMIIGLGIPAVIFAAGMIFLYRRWQQLNRQQEQSLSKMEEHRAELIELQEEFLIFSQD